MLLAAVQFPSLLADTEAIPVKLIAAVVIGVLWVFGALIKWIAEQAKVKPAKGMPAKAKAVKSARPPTRKASPARQASPSAKRYQPAPPPISAYAPPGKSVKQKGRKRQQSPTVDLEPDETHTLLTPMAEPAATAGKSFGVSVKGLLTRAGMRKAMIATAMFDRPASDR